MMRIIGIGNALVDIMVRVKSDELLRAFSLPGGSMQLVDEGKSKLVKSATASMERSVSAGGSIANTIHTLGMLGAKPGYIGSVGSDQTGDIFIRELEAAGVDPVMFRRTCPTGTAVAFVTPDSERTFAVHLGAAVELNGSEINEDLLKGYDILYLEGYLIINFELTLKACRIAKSLGMLVAIDLASYNVVEDNKERFEEIVRDYVDILFANEEEAKALTGKEAEEAARELAEKCAVVIVKTGSKGSIIIRGEEVVKVGVITASPIDTTGAGDMYAAGFLYGFANNEPLARCGEYGATLAGNVIEVMGSKLPGDRWEILKRELFQ